MLWGFSPAQDLLEVLKNCGKMTIGSEVNILLLGCSDPRHILQTLSKLHSHEEQVTINFYVADALTDIIARHLLLLTIAFEPSSALSVFRKTQIWMEIFGNAFLRPQTSEYLVERAKSLIQLVTNSDLLFNRTPWVDIRDLKYKEKDHLETIFRFWVNNEFDPSKYWDARLRKQLGIRFDSKNGVFDWDYFMKMKERPGNVPFGVNEYSQWRRNGVAFVWLVTEYSVSNSTFAMGIARMGDRMMELGYFGDMEVSPYFTFAQTKNDDQKTKFKYDSPSLRGTVIFENNLRRCLYEMENGPYDLVDVDEKELGNVVLKLEELDVKPKPRIKSENCVPTENYSSFPVKHKIHFLNAKFVEKLNRNSKFENFFDVAVVAQTMEKLLSDPARNKTFCSTIKPKGVVLWETRIALFNLKDCDLESHTNFIETTMRENSFEPCSNNILKGSFHLQYHKT